MAVFGFYCGNTMVKIMDKMLCCVCHLYLGKLEQCLNLFLPQFVKWACWLYVLHVIVLVIKTVNM